MLTHYPSQNKEYIVFDFFPQAEVTCAVSMRQAGNMSLFYGDTKEALSNRKDFLKKIGIDYRNLICARQVHGAGVAYVTESDRGKGAISAEDAVGAFDALVTDKAGLPIGIFTADCLPIFLYDPGNRAVGLVHAGWRSSKENIFAGTLRVMQESFNTRKPDLLAAFGPAIRSCCYEVGREIVDFFPRDVTEKSGHYYLELVSANKRKLLEAGIKEENIFDCGLCTACLNEDFFSHRREHQNSGRMMSVAMLI